MNSDEWNIGKQNHVQLADAAAATYDCDYGAFGTRCYMKFEEHALGHIMSWAPAFSLALDLGCGTGRLTRILAERFSRVWGCDFSPEMIAKATRAFGKRSRATFAVHDVEQGLPFGTSCADMINAGFGMFSFIWNSERFIADVRRVLRPGGFLILSCYNGGLPALPPDTPWSPALSARVDKQGLLVTHDGQLSRLNAKPFSPQQLRELLEPEFEVEAIVSLPTLAALLPSGLVDDPRMRALCTAVDAAVAFREDLAAGAYLWVCARKREASRIAIEKACEPMNGRPRVRRGRICPTFEDEVF